MTLKVTFILLAVLLRQVVLSLGALTDEVLSLLVSLGQPEGPCRVIAGYVSTRTTFKVLQHSEEPDYVVLCSFETSSENSRRPV